MAVRVDFLVLGVLSGGETPAASPRNQFSHKLSEGPHVENKKEWFCDLPLKQRKVH